VFPSVLAASGAGWKLCATSGARWELGAGWKLCATLGAGWKLLAASGAGWKLFVATDGLGFPFFYQFVNSHKVSHSMTNIN
jgi:hypothetical protein